MTVFAIACNHLEACELNSDVKPQRPGEHPLAERVRMVVASVEREVVRGQAEGDIYVRVALGVNPGHVSCRDGSDRESLNGHRQMSSVTYYLPVRSWRRRRCRVGWSPSPGGWTWPARRRW